MVSGLHLARKQYELNKEGERLNLVERTVFSVTFSTERFFHSPNKSNLFPFKQPTEIVSKKAVKLIQ